MKKGRPKMKSRKNCIVCEKNMESGRNCQGTPKSVRYLTCSKNCSRRYVRIKVYAISPYAKRIKELKEKMK